MRTPRRRTRAALISASLGIAAVAAALVINSGGTTPRPRVVVFGTHRPSPVRPSRKPRPQALPSPPAVAPPPANSARARTLAKLVGQQLMVRMDGTTPDADLLNRIRRGEVGGVILYAENITSAAQTRHLVSELQQASKAGGNPPLLISTDQEGGQVKRLPWAPPDLSPPQMGDQGPSVSEQQGQQTGTALRNVGINVDLAPVLDVAHSPSSFIWQQGRSSERQPRP